MSTLKDLSERYQQALDAKQDYEAAIANLKLCVADVRSRVCEEYTERLAREHPELVHAVTEAYRNGERIKDEMQQGRRWPARASLERNTYAAILSDVPADQRSEEMKLCLGYWLQFEKIKTEINKFYPPPLHFYWNGPMLVGPNLYRDFGIVEVSQ